MCGLVGCVLTNKMHISQRSKYSTLIQEALYAGALRGRDGTGIAGFDDSDKLIYWKSRLEASFFLDLGETKKFFQAISKSNVFLGHNRKSTTGRQDTASAHPHRVGNIIVTHNGVIPRHIWEEWDKNAISDSAAIGALLNSYEDPVKALEQIQGAYALAWIDSRTNMVHLARNKERPLHYYIDYNDCLVYTSELGLGLWMGERQSTVDLDGEPFMKELEPGELLTIPPGDAASFTITKFAPKETPAMTYVGGYSGGYGGRHTPPPKAFGGYKEGEIVKVEFQRFSKYATGNYGTFIGVDDKGTVFHLSGKEQNAIKLAPAKYMVEITFISIEGDKLGTIYVKQSLGNTEVQVGKTKSKKQLKREQRLARTRATSFHGYTSAVPRVVPVNDIQLRLDCGCSNCGGNLNGKDSFMWTDVGWPVCIDCIADQCAGPEAVKLLEYN